MSCSLFSMSIESEFTSKEYDLEFTSDVYQISTNISICISFFTDTIIDGIDILKKMIEGLRDLSYTNILILNDSSKVIYAFSDSKCYIDKSF